MILVLALALLSTISFADVLVGEAGTNGCDTHLTETECYAYQIEEGYPKGRTVGWGRYPKGCSQNENNKIYFNKNRSGEGKTNVKPLCKTPAAPACTTGDTSVTGAVCTCGSGPECTDVQFCYYNSCHAEAKPPSGDCNNAPSDGDFADWECCKRDNINSVVFIRECCDSDVEPSVKSGHGCPEDPNVCKGELNAQEWDICCQSSESFDDKVEVDCDLCDESLVCTLTDAQKEDQGCDTDPCSDSGDYLSD